MAKPAVAHLQAAKHLLRYLNGTREAGLTYRYESNSMSHAYDAYTDATWGTEQDRVSFQGGVVKRYGAVTSWFAQRQKSRAQSSFEAEIISANQGGKELAWMEILAQDLGERDTENLYLPTLYIPTLFCDNQGTVDFMKTTKFHSKSKHIEIRWLWLRKDMVEKGRLKVVHIAGTKQMSDILTKQLPNDGFRRHCRSMGLDN